MKVKIVQETLVKKSSLSRMAGVGVRLPSATIPSSGKSPPPAEVGEDTFLDSTSAIYNTSVMDENSELWSEQ